MSNEIVLLLAALLHLGLGVGAYKMGRTWLKMFIVLSFVAVQFTVATVGSVFGVSMVFGSILYAGLFFASDMLTEKYGKKEGYRAIRLGFVGAIFIVGFLQLSLLFQPLPFSQDMHDALTKVYGFSLRVTIASVIAYLVAQHFDVWFYHFIRDKTGESSLWVRNNLSTFTSQTLDTFLFIGGAFYGLMPNGQLIGFILSVIAIKWFIALLDTPFMYFAKRHIKPLDMK